MRSLLVLYFLISLGTVRAGTIVVDQRGPVRSLRQAVNMAKRADTILLHRGLYREGNIVVTKSISIIGVDGPVLDGENKHELLTLSGKNIIVSGIHFINAGYSSMNDFAAIKVIDASRVLIENNTLTNTSFAIHISNSTLSVVRNNTITGNNKSEHLSGNGIHLWKCDGMMIDNNRIRGHRDGIYLEFVTGSTIQRNKSERNVRYGLHFMFSHSDRYLFNTFENNGAGVAVMYSKNVHMEYNLFDKNWGASAYGILLKDISNSQILNNRFIQNTVAIHMEGSSRIEIGRNTFKSNGWALKVQASCDDNNFFQNNFFANSFDVATNGSVTLNKFYNNYWDKYDGYDMDRDGYGDVPYHPVSMYAMLVEQNPTTLMLMRSFMVSLLDKAEKAIPSLTPENLVDGKPVLKPNKL